MKESMTELSQTARRGVHTDFIKACDTDAGSDGWCKSSARRASLAEAPRTSSPAVVCE